MRTQSPLFAKKYPKSQPGQHIAGHAAARLMVGCPHDDDGWWLLRSDGGVSRNGQWDAYGQWGFIIYDPAGNLYSSDSGAATGTPVTVNSCEWEGLHAGLSAVAARCRGGTPVDGILIEGDSDLVISQLSGLWQCRTLPLQAWRDRCLDVLAGADLPWHARWIPRADNHEADRLTWRRA